MIDLEHTMAPGDVSRATGLSIARIRQLDSELQPVRTPGGARRYSPQRVRELIERRAAAAK